MLAANPAVFAAVAAVFGLLIGSFLNVVIHRLPLMLERQWRAQCAEITGHPAAAEGEPLGLIKPRSLSTGRSCTWGRWGRGRSGRWTCGPALRASWPR
jgi:hypothetical protein